MADKNIDVICLGDSEDDDEESFSSPPKRSKVEEEEPSSSVIRFAVSAPKITLKGPGPPQNGGNIDDIITLSSDEETPGEASTEIVLEDLEIGSDDDDDILEVKTVG